MFACKIDFILKDDGESVWISSPIVNVYREINELNLTKSYKSLWSVFVALKSYCVSLKYTLERVRNNFLQEIIFL